LGRREVDIVADSGDSSRGVVSRGRGREVEAASEAGAPEVVEASSGIVPQAATINEHEIKVPIHPALIVLRPSFPPCDGRTCA
jgi:hypothetical protein